MGLSDRDYMRDDRSRGNGLPVSAQVSELKRKFINFWRHSLSNKLIVINVAVFLAQQLGIVSTEHFALHAGTLGLITVANLFTYGFLHGSFLHLACNMLALYFLGNSVERFADKKTFLGAYLGGSVAGGVLWLFINGGTYSLLVGASAGICALLSYFCVLNRRTLIQLLLFYIIPVRMYAWMLYTIVFGITLFGLFAWEIPAAKDPAGTFQIIGHSAHLGGLLFGAGIARLAEFLRNRRYGNVRIFKR